MDAIVSHLIPDNETRPLGGELTLEDLEIWVRLGCTAAERGTPQPVLLSVVLRFDAPPRACESDALSDTVCYSELSEIARSVAVAREFNTIESMAWEIGRAVRERLPGSVRMTLRLAKPRAPVPGLRGGVAFTLEA
jgi:dihydroneopterin aldolase